MYDRVIVAVDTSDHASHVMETGIAFAQQFEASIRIVNVFERSIVDALRSSSSRAKLKAERESQLADLESLAAERGLTTTSRLLEGTPATQIAQVAGDEPNSLLVMGRQGRSAISRTLLGGVTERVLGMASVPVVVDPAAETERGPLDLERLLVPTDGSENAALAYPHAGALASRTGAGVHALAVLDLQRAGGVFNAGGLPTDFIASLEAKQAETLDEAASELQTKVPEASIETVGRKTTGFDGVSSAIADYVTEHNIDVVVMGSHGRSNIQNQLLGSVTSTLLHAVDTPVVVVPRSARDPEPDAK